MPFSRRASVVVASVIAMLSTVACFRFQEEPARTISEDASTGTDAGEEVAVVDAQTDAAPQMCDRYGGLATAQDVAKNAIAAAAMDCRIDRFFAALTPDQRQHFEECLGLQIASIMRCSKDGVRVKYPNKDSKGVQCRDMRTSHAGLGIFNEDFDAFVDDIATAFADKKLAAEDLSAILDVLRFERADIVNPGDAGRGDACLPEGGAMDTGADTGGGNY